MLLCIHARPSGEKRCQIYDTRPSTCREFRCAWLGGFGPDASRPDRSGVIVTSYQSPAGTVYVFQLREGHDEKGTEVRRLIKRAEAAGGAVVFDGPTQRWHGGDAARVAWVEKARTFLPVTP